MAGKSFAYVSDTEHQPGETNKAVVDFIKDADGFIYDASFSDAELPDYQGYGHSTWQEGLRLAKLAGVKKYFAFHHMPFRSDEELDEIEMEISGQMPGSGVARECFEFIL